MPCEIHLDNKANALVYYILWSYICLCKVTESDTTGHQPAGERRKDPSLLHFTIAALVVIGFLVALRLALREELKGVGGITTRPSALQRSATEARDVQHDGHDGPLAVDLK